MRRLGMFSKSLTFSVINTKSCAKAVAESTESYCGLALGTFNAALTRAHFSSKGKMRFWNIGMIVPTIQASNISACLMSPLCRLSSAPFWVRITQQNWWTGHHWLGASAKVQSLGCIYLIWFYEWLKRRWCQANTWKTLEFNISQRLAFFIWIASHQSW